MQSGVQPRRSACHRVLWSAQRSCDSCQRENRHLPEGRAHQSARRRMRESGTTLGTGFRGDGPLGDIPYGLMMPSYNEALSVSKQRIVRSPATPDSLRRRRRHLVRNERLTAHASIDMDVLGVAFWEGCANGPPVARAVEIEFAVWWRRAKIYSTRQSCIFSK
jgi:hypothetical protein